MTVKTTSHGASHEAPNSGNVDATEHTPLLTDSGVTRPENDDSQVEIKPLPKMQMFLLCYARMMEPIAFFCIVPFIAQMVQKNGNLPESDIGFYSGLIESLFSAVQMFVLILWGRLADIVGRKPILIYSLVGMSIAPVLFCMSTTLWQMILFRCIAGAFSGSNLVIRTMVTENSTPETQARAFSYFAFGGNAGLFLGPIIGGVLADPVAQYPSLFKGIKFFENYPFALPGLVTGGICATAVVVCSLYLNETLVSDKAPSASSLGDPVQRPEAQMSLWEIIRSPGVSFVLWLYSHVMLLAFIFTAVMPVVLYTSVELGGLGFTYNQISFWVTIQGASQSIWLLFAFPWLQHRLGTKGVLNLCSAAYPLFFALYLVLNVLLRQHTETATIWFYIIGLIGATVGPGVSMAFTGVQLALNDVTPTSRVLGTLNAIALTGASAIRSVAPAVSTALYAIGVRKQILGGHLAWAIFIPIAFIFTIGSHWLQDDKKQKRGTNTTEDEDA